MISAILGSTFLVTLSEMGDKTQLLAFMLAVRFKNKAAILAGILVATLANHWLAAHAGRYLARKADPTLMAVVVGIAFIAFGAWALKPDSADELDEDERTTKLGVFVTTTILFFIAEMGDKTQLATVALAAKFQTVTGVVIGTTLGMMIADGLAVFVGEKIAEKVNMMWVRRGAALTFFLFGVVTIAQAFW